MVMLMSQRDLGTYGTQTVENPQTPEAVGISVGGSEIFFRSGFGSCFALILDSNLDPDLALILDSDPA
jgi:hypothetical protein